MWSSWSPSSGPKLLTKPNKKQTAALVVAKNTVTVSGFALGWGPIPWLVMSEIFPIKVRGVASAVCVLTNWTMAFVITKTFQDMMVSSRPTAVTQRRRNCDLVQTVQKKLNLLICKCHKTIFSLKGWTEAKKREKKEVLQRNGKQTIMFPNMKLQRLQVSSVLHNMED